MYYKRGSFIIHEKHMILIKQEATDDDNDSESSGSSGPFEDVRPGKRQNQLWFSWWLSERGDVSLDTGQRRQKTMMLDRILPSRST